MPNQLHTMFQSQSPTTGKQKKVKQDLNDDSAREEMEMPTLAGSMSTCFNTEKG